MSGKAYHDTMMQWKKAIERRCEVDWFRGASLALNQKRGCYSSRDMDIGLRNSHVWN
jgi:hypothetical protein